MEAETRFAATLLTSIYFWKIPLFLRNLKKNVQGIPFKKPQLKYQEGYENLIDRHV